MAEHGARVLVLERLTSFKDRVRGEAMVPWGAAEAKALGAYEILKHSCAHELPWLDVSVGSTQIAHRNMPETTPKQTPFFSYYHPAMQEVLLQAAAESGAEVRRGARVVNVEPGNPPAVMVEHGGHTETIQAGIVVGADGRASMVRKWAGFDTRIDRGWLNVSGVLFESLPTPGDTASFQFNPDKGRLAFWFPQRDGHVRSYAVYPIQGTIRLSGKAGVAGFIEESINCGVDPETYADAKVIGPLATFDGGDSWVPHPYKDGVALVGDAAACSDPTWGEGLSLTLRDVRELRDKLVGNKDFNAAGHAYADQHDHYYEVIHTVNKWSTQLFTEPGPEADARRARALPLLAEDGSRLPDLISEGPEMGIDEAVRRRFFAEDEK